MAVFRYLIKCTTCDKAHTLRISVGHNKWQEHIFDCTTCSEEIKVGMSIDFEKLSTEIKCIANCAPGTKEGVVVNLNPEFVVPKDQINSDGVFPWMQNFTRDFDLNKVLKFRTPEKVESQSKYALKPQKMRKNLHQY